MRHQALGSMRTLRGSSDYNAVLVRPRTVNSQPWTAAAAIAQVRRLPQTYSALPTSFQLARQQNQSVAERALT
jgi:hypothetical protein